MSLLLLPERERQGARGGGGGGGPAARRAGRRAVRGWRGSPRVVARAPDDRRGRLMRVVQRKERARRTPRRRGPPCRGRKLRCENALDEGEAARPGPGRACHPARRRVG